MTVTVHVLILVHFNILIIIYELLYLVSLPRQSVFVYLIHFCLCLCFTLFFCFHPCSLSLYFSPSTLPLLPPHHFPPALLFQNHPLLTPFSPHLTYSPSLPPLLPPLPPSLPTLSPSSPSLPLLPPPSPPSRYSVISSSLYAVYSASAA